MIRLEGKRAIVVGDATPDWGVLLPRWTDLVGLPLAVERQIGSVWVLSLPEPVPEDILASMAEQLQVETAPDVEALLDRHFRGFAGQRADPRMHEVGAQKNVLVLRLARVRIETVDDETAHTLRAGRRLVRDPGGLVDLRIGGQRELSHAGLP